jgi:hypothetical protein
VQGFAQRRVLWLVCAVRFEVTGRSRPGLFD